MLTTKEQEQILKLAEDLARSRVMAFQRAEMRGDNLDVYLNSFRLNSPVLPAYLKVREQLIDVLKEVG